jgi:hypothetical protein
MERKKQADVQRIKAKGTRKQKLSSDRDNEGYNLERRKKENKHLARE